MKINPTLNIMTKSQHITKCVESDPKIMIFLTKTMAEALDKKTRIY